MKIKTKRFLTIKEFCIEARIGRTTLHRHMKNGIVPSIRIGNRVLIPVSVLDHLELQAEEVKA